MNTLILKKPQILIVDNNRDYTRIIKAMLENKRYVVRTAFSRASMMNALVKGLPDLILLDVSIEETGGFELCSTLKADDRYSAIPIIIFSAQRDSESIIKGFEAGAQDYILKPVNPEELAARIETHIKLKMRTEKLQEMNKEIESFSHMVSHDLKSPIYSIYKLTEYLQEYCVGIQNDDAAELILNIRDKAGEAVDLIEKYSELAKLSGPSFLFEKVNLNQLIDEVYKELVSQYKNHSVNFAAGRMPVIYGDRILLKQVFTNILSNALKFSRTREPASISVRCKKEGMDYLISVEDNGVGFNMKYAGDIFKMFTRLHSGRDFEGSGTGLAIARKIISLHGGKAWINAEEGKGATFHFTIPAGISLKEMKSRTEPADL